MGVDHALRPGSRQAWRVLLPALLASLVAGACGPSESPACSCPMGEVCTSRMTCAVPCADDTACASDQSCLPAGDLQVCLCDQAKCGDRMECRKEHCEVVPCGLHVACMDPNDYCIPELSLCYPLDGDCRADGVCPIANAGAELGATATCGQDTGLCKLVPKDIVVATAPQSIHIDQPMPGDHEAIGSSIAFHWSGASVPVIVLVLDRVPEQGEDFARLAIWGASFGPGGSSAAWSDGYGVAGGVWTKPPPPPEPGVYYLLVEGVSQGALAAVSDLVPFAVGDGGWQELGDPCTGPETPNCYNPAFPAACVDGACRRMCLSNVLDCGENGVCQPPDAEQVRICEL